MRGKAPEAILLADRPAVDGRTLPQQAEELAVLLRLTDRLYRASAMPETFDAALDAIADALGCERASILLFDEHGVMRFVSWRGLSDGYRAAVDGHSPWRMGDLDPAPIFVEDILATDEPDWLKRTVTAEGVRALGFIPLVAQNRTIGKFMTYHDAPHSFTPGEAELAVHIARQVGFSLERARAETARRAAERALRESEERFRLMSEHAPVMIWMSNPDGSCQHLNRMLREFWAVEDEGIAGFDWRSTMHPEDADRITARTVEAITTCRPVTVEGRYRNASGEIRTLLTDARPRLAADGAFLGMIGVNIDTTERARAEAQRELLLAELSHRVKNMLAVVQGIARQSFRNTDSLAEARQTFDGRLMALATAHDLLTRANWETASLCDLARDALPVREPCSISISGPPVLLDSKQTVSLSMALHELFTNAIKYGALAAETGSVALSWTVTQGSDQRLCVEWRETGAPASAPPARDGFGTRLIRQVFGHDLGGEVSMDFTPDGLLCRGTVPLHR